MIRVLGIDPGLTGAVAVLDDGGVTLFDLPVSRGEVNGLALHAEIALANEMDPISAVFVEETHAMPGNGSKANFSQGFSMGTIVTAVRLASLPLHRVAPSAWKSKMGLRGKTKEASRHLASELWPEAEFRLVKHHNRAEAALIARYGMLHLIHTENA